MKYFLTFKKYTFISPNYGDIITTKLCDTIIMQTTLIVIEDNSKKLV